MKRIPENPTGFDIFDCLNQVGTQIQEGKHFGYRFENSKKYWKLRHPLYGFKKILEIDEKYYDVIERAIENGVNLHEIYTIYGLHCSTSKPAIANLIIPKGSIVHCDPSDIATKLRADRAKVHSICSLTTTKRLRYAVSYWGMIYPGRTPQKVIYPERFYTRRFDSICAPGLHFFLSLNKALTY